MKNKWYTYFILAALIIIFGINQLLVLEYNVNIIEYINYSRDFTENDKEILNKYSPIIYGGNMNDPPMGAYYQESGQYLGLAVDHMSAISIQLGENIISRPMVWDHAIGALKKGETDICDMIPSEERGQYFAFTDPIYTIRGVAVARKEYENLIKQDNWEDMKVAVQKSDYSVEFISKRVKKENIIYSKDLKEAIRLLEQGQVQAVAGDEPVIRYFMKELKYMDDYHILTKPIYEEECVLGVPKANSDIVAVLNKAIFTLRKNGTIDKINEKWMLYAERSAKRNTEKLRLIFMISIFLGILSAYTAYMWNKSLKNLVDTRTKQLESTKRELEVTFNGINNMIVILDAEGTVISVNKSYKIYTGKKEKELIGSDFARMPVIKDFEREFTGIIFKILNKGALDGYDSFSNNYELKIQSGIYNIKIFILEHEQNVVGRLAIMIEDVTVQKINQDKLTQENKMSAVGQLAAGVAHELRNPLGIIRNSTFLMNEDWGDQQMREMAIDSIDSSIERAGKIIDNLLNFSRINQSKDEFMNLADMVDEVINLYSVSTKKNKIVFKVNIDQSLYINTNRTSLSHILMNLIQNAVDAIGEDGYIAISGHRQGLFIIMKVEDNGGGISKKDIEKIYEPFFTTKDIGKGTGLGLYIAYTESVKIGSEIAVESMEEKTVFTLKLPAFKEDGDDLK